MYDIKAEEYSMEKITDSVRYCSVFNRYHFAFLLYELVVGFNLYDFFILCIAFDTFFLTNISTQR